MQLRKKEYTIKIYGIRHHGAGSARRLMIALAKQKPDCICIELPQESDGLLHYFNNSAIKPPVGFLFFDPANTHHSITLPFAEFSPEYQAIVYGGQHKLPVISIDLPAAHFLISKNFSQSYSDSLNSDQKKMIADPIAYLARKDGFRDSERWWEAHFEQWENHDELFQHILELMQVLRENSDGLDDEETLIREQWMRTQIRQCIKKGKKNIAVVCGAWHGPVLTKEYIESSQDEDIKPMKAQKIQTALIPWSYRHLSLDSAYSAGLVSPMWHESLFLGSSQAASYFLSHAAQLLRKEGIEIGTSSVIDAELLAYQLALLRHLPMPGLLEVLEAAECIFGQGKTERIEHIKNIALIGIKNGEVPIGEQSMPLIKEFYSLLQQLGLKKYWGETDERKLELDLRKDKHLAMSKFLHSVLLADLRWAEVAELEFNPQGNFHEHWTMAWQVYLEHDLIQLALKSNIWRQAVLKVLHEKISNPHENNDLGPLMEHCMKANMTEAFSLIISHLQKQLLDKSLCKQWLFYVRPIQQSVQYGDIHKIDSAALQEFLQRLIPSILIALPEACSNIDEQEGRAFLNGLVELENYFIHHPQHEYIDLWNQQCLQLIDGQINPLVRGKVWSMLIQSGKKNVEDLQIEIQYLWIRNSSTPVLWLEGFLFQSGAFFLLHPILLEGLDQWLHALDDQEFKKNLVLLRRIFDQVSPAEKARILRTLSQLHSNFNLAEQNWNIDKASFEKISSFVKKYF